MYPLPDEADFCHLYLLRHGATPNNELIPPRIQGQTSNDGLSARGIQQATVTSKLLASFPISAVYASPLRRAHETAATIADVHQLEVIDVDALTECDVGDWGGMTWPEIAANQPERYRQFQEDPATHGYAGGENLRQLVDRVAPAFQRIMQENLGRTVVAVAHNVVNRAFLASLLGVPPARGRSIYQDNCGINVIRYKKDGPAKVLIVNSALHLRSEVLHG
ncbi:MAG: histidine phosphatase family protein [Pirellulales bacterium]|nr:histidine phosphatase family protein [Pirellulales bacterium]